MLKGLTGGNHTEEDEKLDLFGKVLDTSDVVLQTPRSDASEELVSALGPDFETEVPAGAGKPTRCRGCESMMRVHPRGRGEAISSTTRRRSSSGPSPRARGSLTALVDLDGAERSIPAGAGKPRGHPQAAQLRRVHPRGRGEAVVDAIGGRVYEGPWAPVHPRGRGEARLGVPARPAARGPSPRARGSPADQAGRADAVGSIPAGAEKPRAGGQAGTLGEVHPRGRGEAAATYPIWAWSDGPSPRARGSPDKPSGQCGPWGSIPAGAGKPKRSAT